MSMFQRCVMPLAVAAPMTLTRQGSIEAGCRVTSLCWFNNVHTSEIE